MRQDLGVDVVDLMLAGRISCFTAPERTSGASCGRGGIRTNNMPYLFPFDVPQQVVCVG
jgi:hypothetical protein